MQVYVEYSLAENFCMDFALLAIAKATSKNPAKYWRISLSAALGACFAIAYPLMGLGGAAGIIIKLASGLLMCALAGRYQSFKSYVKFSAVFLAATFLLGGGLIAIFSLAGISYLSGGGYIISSVPVGIPIFFAVVLAIAAKKISAKVKACKGAEATCVISLGGKRATCRAFFDSGNKVFFNGSPVSIVPPYVAKQLIEDEGIKTCAEIHTVTGKSKIKVFTAEKLEIDDGINKTTREKVTLGISPRLIYKMVLHPDLTEVI